jgi:streptomycin 6-kinase
MTSFQSNILNIYGDKGKKWLTQLPVIVSQLESRFALRELTPVSNLTCNYALSGFQGDMPVILKLGLDSAGLSREALALKCFTGFGAVRLIAQEKGLLLLEQATPGVSLKSYFRDKDIEAIETTCQIIKKLHQAGVSKDHNFPHIREWLSVLDKTQYIPPVYLQKARKLRDQLLATSSHDVLLHGDLHHDNILQNGEAWVVIDPKGVIGETAYEAAAFIRNPIPALLAHKNTHAIVKNRIEAFAKNLNISQNKIADWCFVQAVLAWIWALEDGGDTHYWEEMIDILYGMS